MASINGFELKKVKEFEGHEGEACYQGDIYHKGKRVGNFKSSYTMGDMDVRFESQEVAKLFNETLRTYINNFPEQYDGSGILYPESKGWFDEEYFILELIAIKDYEKLVKKNMKKGFTTFVIYFDETGLKENKYIEERTVVEMYAEPVDNLEPPENHRILHIITNLNQFNIVF